MHPLKAPHPIEFIDEGNEICFNEEQPSKAKSSIILTEGEIIILVRDVHFLNEKLPIVLTVDGIAI